MDKFSVTLLPGLIRLYKCTRDDFQRILRHKFYDVTKDVLCQTIFEDEVTLYLHVLDGNVATHTVFQSICITDPRPYRVIDIHEDVPGFDHIGIIYRISKRFVVKQIPILYVNTYGHNLILVLDQHVFGAMEVLKEIANV